jgi:subtilisin-like proprotein convertase family protein
VQLEGRTLLSSFAPNPTFGPNGIVTASGHGVYVSSTAIDGTGNVYLYGTVLGTIDFGLGSNTYTTIQNFLAKYSSTGACQSVLTFLAPNVSTGLDQITVDGQGNVYLSGWFSGKDVDLDPTSSVHLFTSSSVKSGKTITYNKDDCLVKLSQSGSGYSFAWAWDMTGASYGTPQGMATDSSNNLYWLSDTRTLALPSNFDPTQLNWNWNVANGGTAIASDPNGFVVVTGSFTGRRDFDPGPGNTTLSSTLSSAFVQKLDAAGNFQWVRAVSPVNPSSDKSQGYDIATDNQGNIYSDGMMAGQLDFDPSSNTYILQSQHCYTYIWKLDESGSLVWAGSIGLSSPTPPSTIAVGQDQTIFCETTECDGKDYDPGPGVLNLTSSGAGDNMVIEALDPNLSATDIGSRYQLGWCQQIAWLNGAASQEEPTGQLMIYGPASATQVFMTTGDGPGGAQTGESIWSFLHHPEGVAGISSLPPALVTTEWGSAQFTVVLTAQPAADVTVPISSGDLTQGTVSPASLTFTSTNWNLPQTVTVSGVPDDPTIVDDSVTYTISVGPASSSDPSYTSSQVLSNSVTVVNIDHYTRGYSIQYYTSIPDGGSLTTQITITDPGYIAQARVSPVLTHPKISDIAIKLIAPDGTTVPLFDGQKGTNGLVPGANFQGTILDPGLTPVEGGSGPFTDPGGYIPLSPLSVLIGKQLAGVWKLVYTDQVRNRISGSVEFPGLWFATWDTPNGQASSAALTQAAVASATSPLAMGPAVAGTVSQVALRSLSTPVAASGSSVASLPISWLTPQPTVLQGVDLPDAYLALDLLKPAPWGLLHRKRT